VSESRTAARLGALDGAYEAGVFTANGAVGVTFELRAGLRLMNLRGAPRAASIGHAFPLPSAPNTSIGVPGGDVLWLGPDEWLLSTERPVPELLARWHGEATDVSHGRCVLRIGGDLGWELLATRISLDLHPRAFAPGACAQTPYGGVGVLLHHLRSGERFDLYIPRSYALHGWDTLRAAADEFGYDAR
jgi:sarcosine oxidase subunit gamma